LPVSLRYERYAGCEYRFVPPIVPRSRLSTAPVTQFLIPVWNDLLSLVLCLPSVLEVADHVVFYDDGSDDGSTDYIESAIRAHPHLDIRLVHGGRQRGWTEARQVLFEHADPELIRVWADADDLIVPGLWPGFLDELSGAGILWPTFYEVWGDHRHTTHWGLRGDACHLALWPGDTRLSGWDRDAYGHTVPLLAGVSPVRAARQCAFHMNGFKTDERLAFKGRLLRAFNRCSPDSRALPDPGDLQREAMRVLFANHEHQPAPMPEELSTYLESVIPEQLRFTVSGTHRLGNEDVKEELARLRRLGFPAPVRESEHASDEAQHNRSFGASSESRYAVPTE